jgi:hypothetical protein
MKDMFALNKLFALNWSIPQMKQILEKLPAVIIQDGAPISTHYTLAEKPEYRPLLGFSAPGSDTIQCYTEFPPNLGALPSRE